MKRAKVYGVGAGLGLLLFYVGVLTVAQGFGHAVGQLLGLWYLLAPLAAGFGVQVWLFFRLRHLAKTLVAASGGLTAGSMVACCAHHLADIVPALGLAGLGLLVQFQVTFMVLGIGANMVGITVMLAMMQKHGYGWARLEKVDMNGVKNGVMAVAVAGTVAVFFITALQPAAAGNSGGAVAKMGETIVSGGTGTGEVSIELTPENVGGQLQVRVAVNTHSVDLTPFDLKQLATLTVGGRDYKPVEAPALGGHHTTGTMVFAVGAADFTIRIVGMPKVAERIFSWRA